MIAPAIVPLHHIKMKTRSLGVVAVVACSTTWPLVADAQTRSFPGDADAGRHLALFACTGCHVVSTDQPFKPIYVGSPHPPDFKDIANKPRVTADSLERYLQALPAVPEKQGMPNMDLTSAQLRDVVAFILSLRDTAAAPSR